MNKLNAYLVGGAVRDRLLGRPVQDRDWVVVGSSVREMRRLGFLQVGKDFPVFLHPETKEEYALARTERKAGSGHRGFTVDANPAVTLEQDLLRRDLTINAIAESVDGELIDPCNGVRDITERRLRHVSQAFGEDPLRVFRVARFAAELDGFVVVPETVALMTSMSASGELRTLAAERVWHELAKALAAPRPERFIATLGQCGALDDWMPELAAVGSAFTDGDALDRFSELGLDEAGLKSLGQRLKVPREYRDAASRYLRFAAPLTQWRQCGVHELHDAFMDLKVVHQMEPLDRLLGAIERHGAQETTRLRELAEGFVRIEGNANLRGREYGDALREARMAWLTDQRAR